MLQPCTISQEIKMTDRAQFEAMLEALINEDQETAKEIFHNIVVGKSREIYEELLESDFPGSEEEEGDEGEEEEGEEETPSNPFGDESEEDDSEEDDSEESDESDEGDLADQVMDLRDALDELKAEFDQLLAGEESEPEHTDMFGGDEEGEEPAFGDEEGSEDEFGAEMDDDDSEVKEIIHQHYIHDEPEEVDEFAKFMEYVNKVALPSHGDNGVQSKSVVDNMKNDMGGTTANMTKNFSTDKGGTQGGLLNPATKPQTGGNVNVPGAKSATKLSNVKQQPMKNAGSDVAPNKKSIVGGK